VWIGGSMIKLRGLSKLDKDTDSGSYEYKN
jgi:hypothetical protein